MTTAPMTIQHSRPHSCQAGVEDEFGSKFMWTEIVREVRERWPCAANYSYRELIGELRDPATLKIALGLEPAASSFLYLPEGGYAPSRSVTRFPEEQR